MISRSPMMVRVTDIPTAGEAKRILGDNPRRVGLVLKVLSAGADVLLYDKPDPVNTGRGYRLASTDTPLAFEGRDSCPRGSFYAGATGAGAELQILETSQEDIG